LIFLLGCPLRVGWNRLVSTGCWWLIIQALELRHGPRWEAQRL
jgi:hypothetical protein